jgi:hypothetical protein
MVRCSLLLAFIAGIVLTAHRISLHQPERPNPGFTRESFMPIKRGMTVKAVESILGCQPDTSRPDLPDLVLAGSVRTVFWSDGNDSVVVWLDCNDRVMQTAYYQTSLPSTLGEILEWFRQLVDWW